MQLPEPTFSMDSHDAAFERAIGMRTARRSAPYMSSSGDEALQRPPPQSLSLVELCRRGNVLGPFLSLDETQAQRRAPRRPINRAATPSSCSSSRRRLAAILDDVLALQEGSDSSSSEGELDGASVLP